MENMCLQFASMIMPPQSQRLLAKLHMGDIDDHEGHAEVKWFSEIFLNTSPVFYAVF